MKCAIIANGSIADYDGFDTLLSRYDLLICCDGGAVHLSKLNILPDIALGDFDSIDPALLDLYRTQGVEIITFPAEKDFTDSHVAIDTALDRGAKQIDLFGMSGNRLDHTLANIFLLESIEKSGSSGRLIDDNNIIFMALKSHTHIYGAKGQTLSLLALSDEVTGITLTGFQYPLNNYTLARSHSVGISNVVLGDAATVAKERGELLIILSRD